MITMSLNDSHVRYLLLLIGVDHLICFDDLHFTSGAAACPYVTVINS